MKGLWSKHVPFASDISGCMSVFAQSSALVVSQDSNGSVSCLRKILDLDALPAFFDSVDLSDLSYAGGDEGRFHQRLVDMFNEFNTGMGGKEDGDSFIVLLNGPVAALLGVDLRSRARNLSAALGHTVFAIETTGNEYYDKGIELAYQEIVKQISPSNIKREGILLLGLNPLDFPDPGFVQPLRTSLDEGGKRAVSDLGYSDSLDAWGQLSAAESSIVMSASGLRAARKLQQERELSFTRIDELDSWDVWVQGLDLSFCGKTLVLGEQLQSNLLRRLLRKAGVEHVNVASFFICDKVCREDGDVKLASESDLVALIASGYSTFIADASFASFAGDCRFFALTHLPSGMRVYDGGSLSQQWFHDLAAACE